MGNYEIVESKQNQCIKIKMKTTGKEFTFLHTSLYKVEYLSFKHEKVHNLAYMWRVH